MTPHNAICEAIDQVLELISRSHHSYNHQTLVAPSPIGKHIRHIIDHLQAFQTGVPAGCIDYNLRQRGTELEHQPDKATDALHSFKQWLNTLSEDDATIDVISEISVNHTHSVRITSSLWRELLYLINHTLHHIAYASLLARSMDIKVTDNIGVAPATATHLRSSNETLACAQ